MFKVPNKRKCLTFLKKDMLEKIDGTMVWSHEFGLSTGQ
jgi:hypothetical protein